LCDQTSVCVCVCVWYVHNNYKPVRISTKFISVDDLRNWFEAFKFWAHTWRSRGKDFPIGRHTIWTRGCRTSTKNAKFTMALLIGNVILYQLCIESFAQRWNFRKILRSCVEPGSQHLPISSFSNQHSTTFQSILVYYHVKLSQPEERRGISMQIKIHLHNASTHHYLSLYSYSVVRVWNSAYIHFE